MSKYSDPICKRLWEASLEGAVVQEFGSTDEAPGRWWGLLIKSGVPGHPHAIVTQDSQGFVDYESFPSTQAAIRNFDRIVREVSAETGKLGKRGDWVNIPSSYTAKEYDLRNPESSRSEMNFQADSLEDAAERVLYYLRLKNPRWQLVPSAIRGAKSRSINLGDTNWVVRQSRYRA